MKEALTSPYKPIFRETLNDEQSVRSNGGIPTAVTFEKGIGKFTGSGSIKYNLPFNGTYTIRVIFKEPVSFSSIEYICDFRKDTGVGYIYCDSTTIIKSSGTRYVNGVSSASSIGMKELVVSGIAISSTELTMGSRTGVANLLTKDLELFEIYQGTLTDSEVKNLYDNDWNKEFISSNLLLDYDSTNGYITDRTGKNTLTATDVSIKKTGSYYGADFNGVTSKIDTGSDFIGTKAITVCGWINPRGWGGSGFGRILDNVRFYFLVDLIGRLRVSSNMTEIASGFNSISLGKLQFVALTRKTDGKASFYIGNANTAPSLSGSVDQNSGTPTAGTTNVIIGNNLSITRTFDGNIPMLKVYEGILDLETITQIWSSTKGKAQ